MQDFRDNGEKKQFKNGRQKIQNLMRAVKKTSEPIFGKVNEDDKIKKILDKFPEK